MNNAAKSAYLSFDSLWYCQKATGKLWWFLGEANILYINPRKSNNIASNLEEIVLGKLYYLK